MDLAYDKTRQISGELNTMGVKQVLAPCIDVVRDLRWGRVEESFGEDPFLCSRMAVAEVKGYMEHGISPMLKHYGPHGNPLGGINLASVECGVRDLFDIYLKPFETVCKETGIMAVMSSYNAWNREPNSASYFMLTEILRNTFGFRGYVYSDWGVIDMLIRFHKTAADSYEAASQVIKAGLDVEASSICFWHWRTKFFRVNLTSSTLIRQYEEFCVPNSNWVCLKTHIRKRSIIESLFIQMKVLLCRNVLLMNQQYYSKMKINCCL